MSSIEERINALGQKRDSEGLEAYIESIEATQLVTLVETKLSNATFTYTWNYILQGLSDSEESQVKRFQVAKAVLNGLEEITISNTQSTAIINRLSLELERFKSKDLVELCDFCLECLQKGTQMSWKELLPEILNVIRDRDCVESDNREISGLEYKNTIINSICFVQWSPENVVSLTSMFIDMPLDNEEHLQVVKKLTTYMEKMTSQELPAFVYQLLRLCQDKNFKSILLSLQHYFSVRIYNDSSTLQDSNNSDNTDLDSIEPSTNQEAIDAESTILFHIHTSASLGQECIKTYLTSLKTMLRSPEFILHPFQLTVLFTISSISYYEEQIFDLIRSCVSRTYNEEQKRTNSALFRDVVPSTCKVETTFGQIINLSAQNRDLVLEGLVNFAFLLLGVGAHLGRDIVAEKQWQLGNMILFKIIKRRRHTVPVIMQRLADCIIIGQNVTQYIECLYMLSKRLTFLMLENKNIIVTLMEGLVQMPGNNGKLLLDAIIPLVRVSPTLRDHFIMLLRKALYSRATDTRKMAVVGFLKLLTNLKISSAAAMSQCTINGSFNSGHSLFTQISVNRASQCAPSSFSNEALCLEILGVLKRCFMQQLEVRVQLYEGLYDAVCLNPELGVPALEAIWPHFSNFYNIDKEVLVPLKFEAITIRKDITVILQEPLGKLIYIIGLLVTKVSKVDPEEATVVKFTTVLDSICERMINCELEHFELDDGTNLLDIVPESQQKLAVLKEAMRVYEALIGYKIYSWELTSENNAKEVNRLFQGYSRLLTFSKGLSKTKKKKADTSTAIEPNTSTSFVKKDGSKAKPFKIPDTILDFQAIGKIINLLHEPMVPWTNNVHANIVKSKRDFHQHIMQATLTLVHSLKHKKIIESEAAKAQYNALCDIAMVLYERIIKRMSDFLTFDGATAVLTLECFLAILNVINLQYGSNLISFFSRVGGVDREEELVVHLREFIETYQKLFEMDEEEGSEDPEVKKMFVHIINTISFLCNQIPTTNNALSVQLMEWLKNLAVNTKISNKNVAASFVSLLFESHMKFKMSVTFFEQIAVCLGVITGVITEEEHNVEEIKVIDESTVNNVMLSLCGSIKSMLEDIEWIISRLRAEFSMITYPGATNIDKKKEHLKSKERGLCCQLCLIITILTHLSNCTVPLGSLSEAILKDLALVYNTLGSLTKYFILRSTKINPIFQNARFERVAKLAGKNLILSIYKLITYIEESQKSDGENKKKIQASSRKNKVLKETRLIPKVVYEFEQFSKFIIQLSNKTKIDLTRYVGQGTVRDFRILKLKEVLEKNTEGVISQETTQDTQESEPEEGETIIDSDEEASPPPTKKARS